jgi:orotate phosphoribosyltransferase
MKSVAEALLEINAVAIQPDFSFTWASGIQSPVYCDNRLLLSYPKLRSHVVESFKTNLQKYYPKAEVVAGTATAGIPHAAFVAHDLDLPMIYVRSKPKEHGKQNLIEGKLTKGAKVVVIEDLISTGKSSLQVVEAIRSEGSEVLGVLSIFTYNLKSAMTAFEKANCQYHSLTDFSELLQVAKDKKLIDTNQLEKIYQWTQTI